MGFVMNESKLEYGLLVKSYCVIWVGNCLLNFWVCETMSEILLCILFSFIFLVHNRKSGIIKSQKGVSVFQYYRVFFLIFLNPFYHLQILTLYFFKF